MPFATRVTCQCEVFLHLFIAELADPEASLQALICPWVAGEDSATMHAKHMDFFQLAICRRATSRWWDGCWLQPQSWVHSNQSLVVPRSGWYGGSSKKGVTTVTPQVLLLPLHRFFLRWSHYCWRAILTWHHDFSSSPASACTFCTSANSFASPELSVSGWRPSAGEFMDINQVNC